jgi:hypothetical protein
MTNSGGEIFFLGGSPRSGWEDAIKNVLDVAQYT